jgi:hypothetical protein
LPDRLPQHAPDASPPLQRLFRGKNVACQVYRDVTDTMRAPTSTLMIRSE